MTSILSTRRFINALASLAGLALVAFALGVALDSHALALFCVTASTLTAMIAVHDYAPRFSYARARPTSTMGSAASLRKAERMPLAA